MRCRRARCFGKGERSRGAPGCPLCERGRSRPAGPAPTTSTAAIPHARGPSGPGTGHYARAQRGAGGWSTAFLQVFSQVDLGHWGRRGRLAEADQVRQKRVRAVHAGRQLAPEAERHVHPPALPVPRLDERTPLRPGVVRKWIGELDKIAVAGVLLAEEVQASFLDPAAPNVVRQLVRRGEHGMRRLEDLYGRSFVGDAIIADLGGIRTVSVRDHRAVVLDDQRPTVLHSISRLLLARRSSRRSWPGHRARSCYRDRSPNAIASGPNIRPWRRAAR